MYLCFLKWRCWFCFNITCSNSDQVDVEIILSLTTMAIFNVCTIRKVADSLFIWCIFGNFLLNILHCVYSPAGIDFKSIIYKMNECSHFLNLQDSISKMVFFVVKKNNFSVWYFDNDDNMKPFMVGFGFAAYLQRTNGKKHFEPFQSFQKHLLHLQYFVGFSLFGFCIIHIRLSQNIRNGLECHSEDDSISIRWIMNYYDADCNTCLRVCALCATILHAGMNN